MKKWIVGFLAFLSLGIQASQEIPGISQELERLYQSITARQAQITALQEELAITADPTSIVLYTDFDGQMHRKLTRKEELVEAIHQQTELLEKELITGAIIEGDLAAYASLQDENVVNDHVDSRTFPGIQALLSDLLNSIQDRQNRLIGMKKELDSYHHVTSVGVRFDSKSRMHLVPTKKVTLANEIALEEAAFADEMKQAQALQEGLAFMIA